MISFRYHLVTLIAVFLALAIGVVMGTTVVRPAIVDRLEGQTTALAREASELRRTVDEQRRDLDALGDFAEQVRPQLVEGKLSGRRVVVVTDDGVDVSQLDAVLTALSEAGASPSGVLVTTPRMVLPDASTRGALASALEVPNSQSAEDLWSDAAAALGDRLANGASSEDGDLLRDLAAADFFTIQRLSADDVEDIGGSDQVVIVIGGGVDETGMEPRTFMVSLVDSLVEAGQEVAAGENEDSVHEFVPLLRERGLDGKLVTVDNLDTTPGQIALVLGLREMLVSGAGGDYGTKDGATGLIPVP